MPIKIRCISQKKILRTWKTHKNINSLNFGFDITWWFADLDPKLKNSESFKISLGKKRKMYLTTLVYH